MRYMATSDPLFLRICDGHGPIVRTPIIFLSVVANSLLAVVLVFGTGYLPAIRYGGSGTF